MGHNNFGPYKQKAFFKGEICPQIISFHTIKEQSWDPNNFGPYKQMTLVYK